MVPSPSTLFTELFAGRTDAHGTEVGGCLREKPPWSSHLAGIRPIGIYPMVRADGVWVVHWGCVDFDVRSDAKPAGDYADSEEAHEAASNLAACLYQFGVMGWVEKTRSDGRHVWVFADEWVPAALMRHALCAACEIVGVSTREVNPKQEELAEGQIGNYVRLPYEGGPNAARYAFDPETNRPLALADFLWRAYNSRASRDELQALADLYIAPRPAVRRSIPQPSHQPLIPDADVAELTARMTGLTYTVFRDGPLDGQDRSGTLYRLACLLEDDGFQATEGLFLLDHADRRWGKYHARLDGEQRLQQLVERVWG